MKNIVKYLFGFIICRANCIKNVGKCYIGGGKIKNKGTFFIGNNSIIRPSTDIYVHNETSSLMIGYNKIQIGNGVLTGPHVFIADHNHNYENPHKPIYMQGVKIKQNAIVKIGDGTWIGTNAVIVGSVQIGKNCVIGANSVVTKNIPDYCIAVGSPAKVIKRYNFESKQWEIVKE